MNMHMYYKKNHIYVGLDLHKRTHTAVAIDCWNEKLFELQMENKPSAFQALLDEVQKHVKDKVTPIYGLEDLLDTLEMELMSKKRTPEHEKLDAKYYEIKEIPVRRITLTHKQDDLDVIERYA